MLGNPVMLHASYIASMMQQKVKKVRVKDIMESKARLDYVQNFRPYIKYNTIEKNEIFNVHTFSDVSFKIISHKTYGQTGFIIGL